MKINVEKMNIVKKKSQIGIELCITVNFNALFLIQIIQKEVSQV